MPHSVYLWIYTQEGSGRIFSLIVRETKVWEQEKYLAMHIRVNLKRMFAGIGGLTDGEMEVT